MEILKLRREEKKTLCEKMAIKENIKTQLDMQIKENKEKKRKMELEKEYEKQSLERKNLILLRSLKEEKDNEKKAKIELKKDIIKFLKNKNLIDEEKKMIERREEKLRSVYQKVDEYLEKKKKTKELILDSKVKIEGIKIFEEIREKAAKDSEIEEKRIKQAEIEINISKTKELLKLERKKMKMQVNLVKEKRKVEENLRRKKLKESAKKKNEIKEREMRQKLDNMWIKMEQEKEKEMKIKLMKNYLIQRKEDADRKRLEKEQEKFFVTDMNKKDEHVMKCCNYVLEKTKELKRPLFPILAAIRVGF